MKKKTFEKINSTDTIKELLKNSKPLCHLTKVFSEKGRPKTMNIAIIKCKNIKANYPLISIKECGRKKILIDIPFRMAAGETKTNPSQKSANNKTSANTQPGDG